MSQGIGQSILIVDDDLDAGQNLGDILADLGYDAHVATGGVEALALAQAKRFEIALLDLKMPGMDGLTLARKLKDVYAGMTVILTTAYANRETLAAAHRNGIWKVFPKPLDLQHIIPSLVELNKQPMVLLIEDDADLCHSLSDVLSEKGYRVSFATEIDHALAQVRNTNFQVILLDMKLQGAFGDEVLTELRSLAVAARVILLTGYRHEMAERIQRSMELGAKAVCYKPFELPELLDVLRHLTTDTAAGPDS